MPDCPPRHTLYIPKTPTTYTLEITSFCNNACVGCGNVFSHQLGEWPVEHWRVLLDRLRPHLVNIRVTGGEPTLHRQFSQLIQVIDRYNVPFVLFSNGVWKNRAEIIQVLSACENLDGILLSLHGKDSHAHQQFVGRDTFAETVETLRQAAQAGLTINTNTVLTRANFQDVETIAKFALDLGARAAAFSRYYGDVIPLTTFAPGAFKQAIEAVYALQREGLPVRFNNNVPGCFSGHPSKSCPAGITHCTIDPVGNVRPCNHIDRVFGNLFETPIETLWQSEKAALWRDLIPQACYQCAEFERCRGGCKAMALRTEEGRDPLMQEPLDETLKSNTPHSLKLYAGSRPLKNFIIRREDFGLMLINRSRIVIADFSAEPLLSLLDGQHSLATIQQASGREGLNFIGKLYTEGLVRLLD